MPTTSTTEVAVTIDGAKKPTNELDKEPTSVFGEVTDKKEDKKPPSLRELYRYADCRDMVELAAGSVALLASGVNQPLQLVVFGRLMDSFNLTDKEAIVEMVHFFAGLYASLGVMQIVTNSVQTSCFAAVAARQAQRMRLEYFKALARRPIAWFDAPGRDAGALASSVMEKAMQVQTGIGDDLVQLVQRLLAFVLGFGFACYFSWPLALVSAAAVPLLAVVVGVANAAYGRATKGSAERLDKATSTPLEAVSAIRTVAAFGREAALLGRFATNVRAAKDQGLALGRARAGLEGVTSPIMFIMFGTCLWFGSKLVADDMEDHEYCRFINATGGFQDPDPWRCTTGGSVMTSFLNIVFGFMGMLQALPSIASLSAAKASAAGIFEAIDAPLEECDALNEVGEKPSGRAAGRIELRDVTFAYPARREVLVYDSLSLTIEAGQTAALAGPSGCGKSTLVALLERWYDVDGGSLCLDGTDVRKLSVRWLRSQIGLVSQEPVLFSGSIGWNIGLGAGEGEGGAANDGAFGPSNEAAVTMAARLANAHNYISEFPDGYGTQVGEKGVQLSGGQKQRIAIARALVRDPSILVLDEATSALDAESERVVQVALDEIMAKQKRTTILIAHRLSTIRNADKICVVSGGKLVEEGPHDDLVEKDGGVYRALVEAQTVAGAPAPSEPKQGFTSLTDTINIDVPLTPLYASVVDQPIKEAVPKAATAVVEAVAEVVDTLAEDEATGAVVAVSDAKDAKGDKAKKDAKKKANLSKPARRWIWSQTAPEALYYASGVVGAAITGLTMPAIGLLMAEFVTVFYNVDVGEMRTDARKWGLVFLIMGAVVALGAVVRQISFSVITERMVLRVRLAAFESILRQPVGWFDQPDHTAGALANRLAQDCYQVKALTGERAGLAVSQLAVMISGLFISFSASWQLTLSLFGIIPLIVVPVAIQAKVVQKFAEKASDSLISAGQTASETLLQLRTVAAFGLELQSVDRFERELRLPLEQDIRKGAALGIGTGVAAGTILLGAAFQYFIGGIYFDLGLVEFPDIMKCLLVLIFMAFGFTAVSRDAADRAEATLAAARIYGLISSKSDIDGLATSGEAPSGRAAGRIELRDVTFAYPARREVLVYDSLSLTIEAGQTAALAGPSGCGKSTLVALLERWYDVDGGSLCLDGTDVRKLSVRWLRSQIGLVSQEPVLFSGSIGWNIGLGAGEGEGGAANDGAFGPSNEAAVTMAARLANAHNYISEFPDGYGTQVGEKGVQLSGGQKQRIAIARALVRDPSILVLDEATSALDAESERVVQVALDEIMAKQKRTTILIAHRLSTIRNADKICVVSGGKLVEEGPHDDLVELDGGVYKSLVAHAIAASTPTSTPTITRRAKM